MRISDWSSDVCSSDLPAGGASYLIRYACSGDGLHWTRAVEPCIDFAHDGETAIARPSVLRDGDGFRMWYCYRGKDFAYRLGYAESGRPRLAPARQPGRIEAGPGGMGLRDDRLSPRFRPCRLALPGLR